MSEVEFRIYRHILQQMVEHARVAYPLECCGLLSGKGRTLENIAPMSNARGSSSEFFVPPQELFAFFKALRGSGHDLLGIYHSHPHSQAVPSRRDSEGFHYPDASYWIISLQREDPDVRCYRWVKIGFEEVEFSSVETA